MKLKYESQHECKKNSRLYKINVKLMSLNVFAEGGAQRWTPSHKEATASERLQTASTWSERLSSLAVHRTIFLGDSLFFSPPALILVQFRCTSSRFSRCSSDSAYVQCRYSENRLTFTAACGWELFFCITLVDWADELLLLDRVWGWFFFLCTVFVCRCN